MSLRRYGFFRELPHGAPTGPSLVDTRGKLPPDYQARIADYLRAGAVLAATGEWAADWFTRAPDIAPLELRTDGVWVWPADLAFYVEHYSVEIPQEFVRRMSESGWCCPKLGEEELVKAADDFFSSP